MTLRWYYAVDAGTVLEITDRVRLPTNDEGEAIGVGSHAEAGSGWEGDLLIDDPGGTLPRPKLYRRIYCDQDAAPAGSRVVGNWFISGVKVRRMDPWGPLSRRYVVTMADENSLLSRRKWTGADANRPSETDIARIRWALLETELNTLSPDETYIDTDDPITMEASDLRDHSPEEMLMTLFQRTGKEHWVKYEEQAAVGGAIVSSSVANPTVVTTTSAHGLTTGQSVVIAGHTGSTPTINGTRVVTVTGATTFTIPVNVTVGGTGGTTTTIGRYVLCYFDPNTSDLLPSTVSISNDPADTLISADNPTSLVYPLGDDAELDGTGGRFSSGLIVPHLGAGKRVYAQNDPVGLEYAFVDNVANPPIPIKTAAEATAYATRELAELAVPDDEVTTPIWVRAARLNLVMHGMIVPVHATHFPNFNDDDPAPGWEDGFVDCRVKKRIVTQEGPTDFRLDLTLSPMQTVAETSVLWANLRAGPGGFGIDAISHAVLDSSPGFVNPVGGASVVPGDGIAALFVMAWTMQAIVGSGQTIDPDPPGEPVMMIANAAPPTSFSDYEAGLAEMIIDPTSGSYSFTGNAGGVGRDGMSTIACFPSATGSPYTRVQSAIANGTVTLGSPATAGNLLILAIACSATGSYFPGFPDTDTPDIPEQTGWTAVAPRAYLNYHFTVDYWGALRMFYKTAAGGETAITIDPGTWPYSTGMVVEYAP